MVLRQAYEMCLKNLISSLIYVRLPCKLKLYCNVVVYKHTSRQGFDDRQRPDKASR